MEWSNNLAKYIIEAQKSPEPYQETAYFTTGKWQNEVTTSAELAPQPIPFLPENVVVPDNENATDQEKIDYLIKDGKLTKATLTVRKFFQPDSL